MSDQPTNLKAILYTDGGYRQQYQSGGWGVHGYTYTEAKPDKGTGNPKAVPTSNGYAGEKTKGEPVTINSYIDGVGGMWGQISNNTTELQATIKGIEHVLEKGYEHTRLYTDSQYVVNGMTKWIYKWEKVGWVNQEGRPIANKDLWLTGKALMERAKLQGVSVELNWIKGHAGHFGNEMADQYASRGNVLGRKNSDFTFMLERPAAGYWNKKGDFNRLLSSGRWYFQTTDYDILTKDGETIYYLGEHTTNDGDELIGKRVSDNAMCVLYLKEPDPVMEMLRKQAMDLDAKKFGSVMIGRMDVILNPVFYADTLEHGTQFLDTGDVRKDILTAKRRPIAKEQSPPGLVYNAVDCFNSLQRKLDSFKAGEKGIWVTEITDLLYDVEEKKSGVTRKVKKELVQSTKYLDIPVRYSTKKVVEISGEDDPDVKIKKVRFILGMDLAKRNTLSHIAGDVIRVVAITWRESETVIRYATVIETSSGQGIWAGIDSNFLMV